VSKRQLRERGGKGLLEYYPSLPQALKAVYPDQPWDADFEAGKPSFGYWKNKTNFLKELDRIEKLLGITQVIRIYISQILRSSPNFQQ